MTPERKSLIKRYAITISAGIAMVCFCLFIQNFRPDLPPKQIILKIANAFTATATLILGIGCLVFISNHEGFLTIGYSFGHMIRMMIPGRKKVDERYYDYVERKRAKGKIKGYGFLFVTGGAFMVIAVIFTILFY